MTLRYRYVFIIVLLNVVAGCDDMFDQPRYETYEPSAFFADGMSARPPVAGTVARGQLQADRPFHTGRGANGALLADNPLSVSMAVLERGRQRFDIYCAPCHSRTGDGDGMIVQRGYPAPPTFHSPRLRGVPDGHLFEVISSGYGKMPPYRAMLSARDRWSIAAYVRALQRSRDATIDDVPPDKRHALEAAP